MKNKINGKEELPGYPHYPVREDLLNAEPENRIDGDVEDLLANPKLISEVTEYSRGIEQGEFVELVPGNEADVTQDDLYSLGSVDSAMNESEDEKLIEQIAEGPDLTGDDLDVPGSNEDRFAAEEAGSEDEENKLYSWGQGDW